MMSPSERVGIGELRLARAPTTLVAHGLGSCLGITLYDRHGKVGGLAHALLPAPGSQDPGRDGAKDVVTAVRRLVAELVEREGAAPQGLEGKLAGGSNMFGPASGTGVGARNIQAARATFEELGILLVAEDVGGNRGRTVAFDLQTGDLKVRTVRGGEKIITL